MLYKVRVERQKDGVETLVGKEVPRKQEKSVLTIFIRKLLMETCILKIVFNDPNFNKTVSNICKITEIV